jgi:hypothetical protein
VPSYVTTADAISKYFSDDPEWCLLADNFNFIARGPGEEGGPKDDARAKLKRREFDLFNNVYQAVVGKELPVLVAFDGASTFFQLPDHYLLTAEMLDALKKGWAGWLRLNGRDKIWNGARLVFAEENWRQWLERDKTFSTEAVPEEAAASAVPKPKLSQTAKNQIFCDYIARQPAGPIKKSKAEKELMKSGLSREYIRAQLNALPTSRLLGLGRPPT